MRSTIYIAIAVSVCLIGGAFWIRLNNERRVEATLAVVEGQDEIDSSYEKFAEEFLSATSTSLGTSTPQKLSGTDLISRQLFSDYITLATQGQATDASVNALLERYIESIPTLNTAEAFTYLDFQSSSNNKNSLTSYNQAMKVVYQDYRNSILGASVNGSDLFNGTIDPQLAALLSQIYRKTAEKMRVVPVPAPILPLHLSLANVYLQNASAMKAISLLEKDSASAFAGLIALSENTSKERELLGQINTTLRANGI